MKILTVKDTSIENITLGEPEHNDDVIYVDIKNEKNPLYIQTPKMYISEINGSKVKLYFDNEKEDDPKLDIFYELIQNIEQKICSLISKNSSNWFPEEISSEDLMDNLFNSSLKLPKKFKDSIYFVSNIPYENDKINFEIYNQRKQLIKPENIKEDTEIITLLLANEVIITSSSAHVYWEVAQMKVYKKRESHLSYKIRKEEETLKKLNVNVRKSKKKETKKVKQLEEKQLETKKVKKSNEEKPKNKIVLVDDEKDDISEYDIESE